jgi:hypothetical protein
MPKSWLRKRQVAQRYGDSSLRFVERAVKDGRIPPPEYPCGDRPFWDEEKLEANERAAVRNGPNRQIAHDEDDRAA